MNDDPPQIVLAEDIVGPDDWSNGLSAATDAGHKTVSNIRIVSFRSFRRIMQPGDRQSDRHSQTDTLVANRFLQDDETTGVLFFVWNHPAKGDFSSKGVQRLLRIKDRGFDTKHFELLEVATTGVAHANECRRSQFSGT
jgi:hypothetical protein